MENIARDTTDIPSTRLAWESLRLTESGGQSHIGTLGNSIYHLARPYVSITGSRSCGHTESWHISFGKVNKDLLGQGFGPEIPQQMVISIPNGNYRTHLVFTRETPSADFILFLINSPDGNFYPVDDPDRNKHQCCLEVYKPDLRMIINELITGLVH